MCQDMTFASLYYRDIRRIEFLYRIKSYAHFRFKKGHDFKSICQQVDDTEQSLYYTKYIFLFTTLFTTCFMFLFVLLHNVI